MTATTAIPPSALLTALGMPATPLQLLVLMLAVLGMVQQLVLGAAAVAVAMEVGQRQ
jgi:hypothetical protein